MRNELATILYKKKTNFKKPGHSEKINRQISSTIQKRKGLPHDYLTTRNKTEKSSLVVPPQTEHVHKTRDDRLYDGELRAETQRQEHHEEEDGPQRRDG